ncbi:hypothetical protein [Flavobacterium marginilacus]|uniref:hypothetical protein n=1 Tax=Flavobacterium marginilacus TaxID=3003256 RepID=UPI00248D4359|nr:hypothetical protein [Flavobacterium marginilacus]
MQIKVKEDCFYKSDKYIDLDAIFSLIKERQHAWIDIDLEELSKTLWYQELGKRDKDDLKRFTIASTRKIKNKLTINISEDNVSPNTFNIIEAKIYLKQPLSILVENSQYETPFINSIIRNFDFESEINYAKEEGWLVYENLGGGNNNAIEGKINESFNHPFLTKDKSEYLRTFVIKDSDREYCSISEDGSTVSQQQLPPHKISYFKERNIPYHIWYKREKENYIPNSVYINYETDNVKKEYVKAYLRLNNHQMDFLDIEKGFSYFDKESNIVKVKDRNELKPEIKKLYCNISEDDYKILGLGFSVKYQNFKVNFSNEFATVSRDDMLSRINHQTRINSIHDEVERNEFDHIIHEIKRLL